MNTKKDISKLIKDNAHKLEERPSKQAWERLEQRLDQQPVRRRFTLHTLTRIAAAMIGLVAAVSLIGYLSTTQDTKLAANTPPDEPFMVEALEVSSDEERGFYKVVEFQKKYQDRLSNPIIEGSGKKLAPARFVKAEVSSNTEPKKYKAHNKLDHLKQEAKNLIGGNCLHTVKLEGDKAIIRYQDDQMACQSGHHSGPVSDVIVPWKNTDQIEKMIISSSVQLLLNLDFLNATKVTLPAHKNMYTIELSRKELEAYTGKSITTLKRGWNNQKSTLVQSKEERQKFLAKFGTIESRYKK